MAAAAASPPHFSGVWAPQDRGTPPQYTSHALAARLMCPRARNARVLSFARACSSPYTPRGTALAFGPLALRSCLCCTACQNQLARTAVANPRQIRSSPPNHRISCRRPDSADSPHCLCPHRARPRAPGPGHAVTQAGRRRAGRSVLSGKNERGYRGDDHEE